MDVMNSIYKRILVGFPQEELDPGLTKLGKGWKDGRQAGAPVGACGPLILTVGRCQRWEGSDFEHFEQYLTCLKLDF